MPGVAMSSPNTTIITTATVALPVAVASAAASSPPSQTRFVPEVTTPIVTTPTIASTVTVPVSVVSTATPSSPTQVPTVQPSTFTIHPPYLFGTLLSEPSRAAEEYAAGVRIVQMDLGWDRYEPREGVFDPIYLAQTRATLDAFEAAGLKVVLGVGLQYPPAWAYAYPDSRYVNQFGAVAGPLNLTFNQPLRERAARYIARVHGDLDLNRFWAVRVGAGGAVEAFYPAEDAGGQANGYWAYDAAAQGGAGRPGSIPAPPYPGWRPGEASYGGRPFGAAQVQEWLDWYLGALADTVNWQLDTYRGLGYTGYQQVLLPGVGTKPAEYAAAVAARLARDPNGTLGRGAAWDRLIAALRPGRNVVVYVSSMADGSGGDDRCAPGDAALDPGDARIVAWSATRWIAYKAGLPTMGENPGPRDSAAYGSMMLQAALAQVASCGMLGLMWAHDADLYRAASGVSLVDFAASIRRYGAGKQR